MPGVVECSLYVLKKARRIGLLIETDLDLFGKLFQGSDGRFPCTETVLVFAEPIAIFG